MPLDFGSLGILFWFVLVWSMVWKGIALWKAGRNGQLGWFIAMFIVNTAGILAILYIFVFGRKRLPAA